MNIFAKCKNRRHCTMIRRIWYDTARNILINHCSTYYLLRSRDFHDWHHPSSPKKILFSPQTIPLAITNTLKQEGSMVWIGGYWIICTTASTVCFMRKNGKNEDISLFLMKLLYVMIVLKETLLSYHSVWSSRVMYGAITVKYKTKEAAQKNVHYQLLCMFLFLTPISSFALKQLKSIMAKAIIIVRLQILHSIQSLVLVLW